MAFSSASLDLLNETGVELGEYLGELQRLGEQFNMVKWKNADNILQVVLKESNKSRDMFFKLAKKMYKSIKWFNVNRKSLESICGSIKKRKIYNPVTDNIMCKLHTLSSITSPNFIQLSDIVEIKEQAQGLKNIYVSYEWEDAMTSLLEYLKKSATAVPSLMDPMANLNHISAIKASLKRLMKHLKDDIWLPETLPAREAIETLIDRCLTMEDCDYQEKLDLITNFSLLCQMLIVLEDEIKPLESKRVSVDSIDDRLTKRQCFPKPLFRNLNTT